jgi:hypothetical protein
MEKFLHTEFGKKVVYATILPTWLVDNIWQVSLIKLPRLLNLVKILELINISSA